MGTVTKLPDVRAAARARNRPIVKALIASSSKKHPLDDMELAALGRLLNTLDDTPYPAPSGEPGTLTNFLVTIAARFD